MQVLKNSGKAFVSPAKPESFAIGLEYTVILPAVFALLLFAPLSDARARDFLTEIEITQLRNAPNIDKRTDIYMDAALMRLRSVQDRFEGKESEPGDAMEFYSQQDMLDDYTEIMNRVVLIVGDAFEMPHHRENTGIKRALNILKSKCSESFNRLAELRKNAEKKQLKSLLNNINHTIDVINDILDGAKEGLALLAEREKENEKKRRESMATD